MKFSPRTANTLEQICTLRRDNVNCDGFWALVDGDMIHLVAQHSGESPTAEIALPKKEFDKIIRWYRRPTRHKP